MDNNEDAEKVVHQKIKEDVNAIFEGTDLSEDFKEKVSNLIEASIDLKVKDEMLSIQEKFEAKLEQSKNEHSKKMVEALDGYVDEVVNEWFEENEIAIESGIMTEAAENIITGISKVFTENSIDVENMDILESYKKKNDSLTETLVKTKDILIEAKNKLSESTKSEIISEATDNLSRADMEKVKEMMENIEINDEEHFKKKVESLSEMVSMKSSNKQQASAITEEVSTNKESQTELSEEMAAYTSFLNRSANKNKI